MKVKFTTRIKVRFYAWIDRKLKRIAATAGNDVCPACGTVVNVVTARVPEKSLTVYGRKIKCPCCSRPLKRKWVPLKK